ncbi:hypothetical protein EVAR_36342_1 [Eumeta japonica]|uniref:Uncharacterized protein n=1 Tax=Eumeta variegata TaxID=151549 RepID=A0A4C1W5R9_EUMVA|nr:hypothetical protein EVAR_36342_1 [Eumeta japonica]
MGAKPESRLNNKKTSLTLNLCPPKRAGDGLELYKFKVGMRAPGPSPRLQGGCDQLGLRKRHEADTSAEARGRRGLGTIDNRLRCHGPCFLFHA